MTGLAQLQHLAGTLGIEEFVIHSTPAQLIRLIQQRRGEEPCFTTDKRNDCAEICEWRRECRPHKAAWLR